MDYTGLTPEKIKQIFENSRNEIDKFITYEISGYEEREYLRKIECLNEYIEKYKNTMNRFKIFEKFFRDEKQITEWEQEIKKISDEHALFCQAKKNNQIFDFCFNNNLLDNVFSDEKRAMLLAKVLKEDKIQNVYLDTIRSDDSCELVIEYLDNEETDKIRKIIFNINCRRTIKESYFRSNYGAIYFLYNPNN